MHPHLRPGLRGSTITTTTTTTTAPLTTAPASLTTAPLTIAPTPLTISATAVTATIATATLHAATLGSGLGTGLLPLDRRCCRQPDVQPDRRQVHRAARVPRAQDDDAPL